MQQRRAELLNRRIRRRIRDKAGARPDPHADRPTRALLAREPASIEARIELVTVGLLALLVPVGWPLGRLVYMRTEALIPARLRAYPIPAYLWAAVALGVLTNGLYAVRGETGIAGALLAPWLLAQIPAAFLTAGIYGILNGWLAIPGSTDWWPVTPAPPGVDLALPLGPDDLTGPGIFPRAEPAIAAHELTPVTRAQGHSVRLIIGALLVSVVGIFWTVGVVAVGTKAVLLQPITLTSGYR
ncbi:hypothetical protein [Mycolicibacterium fallax]|nr:hypothetical protein [Mycolicibacterium fallax]